MSLHFIQNLLKTELAQVEKLIKDSIQSKVPLVNDLIGHIIQSGGKRIRPVVVLLAAKATHASNLASIKISAIVEFIHTATLLHDDVIDQSKRRRGRPTANHIWGNKAAILAGDYLYSKAFQLMVELDNHKIMDILANASNVISEGEILQLTQLNDLSLNEKAYYRVIESKTATLFEASAGLGALMSKDENYYQAFSHFGKCIGIAFQLIDDLLDYQANNHVLGKNKGDDLLEGKPTLPLIFLMQQGLDSEKELIQETFASKNLDHFTHIVQAMQRCGAFDYTLNAAKSYVDKARNAIQNLPKSPYLEAAYELANYAIERKN